MSTKAVFTTTLLLLCRVVSTSHPMQCRYPQTGPLNESYTRLCLPKDELNRTFSLSTRSPLSKALSMNPMGQLTVFQLIAHFTHVGDRIQRLSRQRLPKFTLPVTALCSLHQNIIPLKNVNQTMSELGFGLLGNPCVTEITIKRKDTPNAAIDEFVSELKRVGIQVAKDNGRLWKEAHTYQKYKYMDRFDKCDLTRIAGIRTNGKWGVHASITNFPSTVDRAERRREIISEVLQINDFGGISSVRMVLPSLRESGKWIYNSSTLLQLRNDIRGASLFDERSVTAENPAVLAAIELRKHFRQQAQAYTLWSQISILAIPVLTCLVPVAYFTDLSSPVSFWYSVSKNILSSVPLLIKGIELVQFARGNKYLPEATKTRFYGVESGIAVAETWFASCEVKTWVWFKGVSFIVFCSIVWVASVVLEFTTMKIGVRKRVQRNMAILAEAKNQSWNTAICSNCGCSTVQPTQASAYDASVKGFIAAEMTSMM